MPNMFFLLHIAIQLRSLLGKSMYLPYSRYYKMLSNISPSWIEDAPKDARKKQVLGPEDPPKSLKNKYKGGL